MLDAALEDHVHPEVGPPLHRKHQLTVVDDLRLDAARLELGQEQLLLHAHA